MQKIIMHPCMFSPNFRRVQTTSALPLVVRVYTVGFVKCFDIATFCFILNQSGQLWIKEKIKIFYWFKSILQSFKLSLLTGLSELCYMSWVAFTITHLSHLNRDQNSCVPYLKSHVVWPWTRSVLFCYILPVTL